MPCGSETAPRTIWSAWRVSTPSRSDRIDGRVVGRAADVLQQLERRLQACTACPASMRSRAARLATGTLRHDDAPRGPGDGRSASSPTVVCGWCGSWCQCGSCGWCGASSAISRRRVMPIERAVPSMMSIAASTSFAFRSGHLLLGDLAHLRLRDLADLDGVRGRRALGDPGGTQQELRRRRRLHDERERAVLVDGDLDRDDVAPSAERSPR